MGQRANQVRRLQVPQDPLVEGDAEIQQTREEISETLEAIEAKLAPDRLTEDAREAAIETVDHVVEEAKTTAQELSELASVAAMEAVDHALVKIRDLLPELQQQVQASAREASELASVAAMEAVDHALVQVREALPDLSQHAQDTARASVDHAVLEVKAALQEIGNQTKAAVRDATIGRVERMASTTNETSRTVGTTIVQTVKQNPGPAALTALGLGWLVVNGRSGGTQGQAQTGIDTSNDGSGAGVTDQLGTAASQAQAAVGDVANQAGDVLVGAADQAADAAFDAAGVAIKGAGTVVGGVTHGTTTVVGGVAQGTTAVASGLAHTVAGAGSKAKQVPTQLRHMVEENPMRMGAVAIALGSVAALSVPETQRENQLLGEARDTLIDKAQATAQSTIQKVQNVAEEVGETVEKEAKYQGLSTKA